MHAVLAKSEGSEVETGRRLGWIAGAALVGMLALGVILTIRLGKGTVIIEGPDDGGLPPDVNVVLRGGSDPLEISSANQWKLAVQPGTYQVEIIGGSDTFEVKQREIVVKRSGKQVIKITRHEVAAAPISQNATPPVSPETSNSAASKLAGRWKIKEAENFAGETYGGTIDIHVSSTGVVELKWLDDQGQVVQTGVGMLQDGHLVAAWGAVPAYGFCLYKLLPDGKMEARWSAANAGGRSSHETASGGTPGKLEGTYNIQGTAIGSEHRYTGTLSIAMQGDTYAVEWTVPEGNYTGVGLRLGDYLAIGWGSPQAHGIGVVDYKLNGDNAQGRWTMIGQNQLSFEIIEREAAK